MSLFRRRAFGVNPVTSTYRGYSFPNVQRQYLPHSDYRIRMAIYKIENIKRDISQHSAGKSPKSEHYHRGPSSQIVMSPSSVKSESRCNKRAGTGAIPADVQVKETTGASRTQGTAEEKRRENVSRNRREPIIYQAHAGLLPNYAGFVPGHRFIYGKTWGVSTVDALSISQKTPFQWTSLI